MTICNLILTPVVSILHVLIAFVRFLSQTLCGWVTTTIKVIKKVTEKICGWLPWPLNGLCKLVTKLIEIIDKFTEWVCDTIIVTFIDFIALAVELLIFIVKWVCWLIDWIIFRWLALAICAAGIELRKCIPICLTILTDENDNQTISVDDAQKMVDASNELLRQCDINLVIGSIRIIKKPDLIINVPTGANQLFSFAFAWFSRNVCDCCKGITIYFISTLDSGAKGHAIPGSNYILVAVDSIKDNATIVHEIGHLADLWMHDDEDGNVMSLYKDIPRTRLRKLQCCLIGSSRFSHACGHG